MGDMQKTLAADDCLEYSEAAPEACAGAVEYRMALSPSGRAFPRCDRHWSARLDEQERITERLGNPDSDIPPAWFDPTAIGERWNEDD